jgi:hypothetical protein
MSKERHPGNGEVEIPGLFGGLLAGFPGAQAG